MSEPNYLINAVLNKIPTPARWAIGVVLIVIVIVVVWYGASRVWNGIGNFFFARQINAERVKVQKELTEAAEQKKALEETLKELAVAKKDYADAKAEKDRLEGIFNDQSISAAKKVAAFKASLSDDPERTATDGISNESLCERAKAVGASAATVASLCGF
jgi:hypothetical protein